MKRLTGEFLARDGRGNCCTLEVWTDFLGPGVQGDREIRTSKGEKFRRWARARMRSCRAA